LQGNKAKQFALHSALLAAAKAKAQEFGLTQRLNETYDQYNEAWTVTKLRHLWWDRARVLSAGGVRTVLVAGSAFLATEKAIHTIQHWREVLAQQHHGVPHVDTSHPEQLAQSHDPLHPTGPNCFLAGTIIHTPDGDKDIATLKAGDAIYTFDETTEEKVAGTIGKIRVVSSPSHVVINNLIHVTQTHPFYVLENGKRIIKRVGELRLGDVLIHLSGKSIPITSLVLIEKKAMVYHLIDVTPNHNYFAHSILVHNVKSAILGDTEFRTGTTLNPDDYASHPDTVSWSGGGNIDMQVIGDGKIKLLGTGNGTVFFTEGGVPIVLEHDGSTVQMLDINDHTDMVTILVGKTKQTLSQHNFLEMVGATKTPDGSGGDQSIIDNWNDYGEWAKEQNLLGRPSGFNEWLAKTGQSPFNCPVADANVSQDATGLHVDYLATGGATTDTTIGHMDLSNVIVDGSSQPDNIGSMEILMKDIDNYNTTGHHLQAVRLDDNSFEVIDLDIGSVNSHPILEVVRTVPGDNNHVQILEVVNGKIKYPDDSNLLNNNYLLNQQSGDNNIADDVYLYDSGLATITNVSTVDGAEVLSIVHGASIDVNGMIHIPGIPGSFHTQISNGNLQFKVGNNWHTIATADTQHGTYVLDSTAVATANRYYHQDYPTGEPTVPPTPTPARTPTPTPTPARTPTPTPARTPTPTPARTPSPTPTRTPSPTPTVPPENGGVGSPDHGIDYGTVVLDVGVGGIIVVSVVVILGASIYFLRKRLAKRAATGGSTRLTATTAAIAKKDILAHRVGHRVPVTPSGSSGGERPRVVRVANPRKEMTGDLV